MNLETGGVFETHSLASSNRPLFIDIAIGELVRECGTSPASVDAAHLLVEVDSVITTWQNKEEDERF